MSTYGSNRSENNTAEKFSGDKLVIAERLRQLGNALYFADIPLDIVAPKSLENGVANPSQFETPANAEVNYHTSIEAQPVTSEFTELRAMEQAARNDLEDIHGVS